MRRSLSVIAASIFVATCGGEPASLPPSGDGGSAATSTSSGMDTVGSGGSTSATSTIATSTGSGGSSGMDCSSQPLCDDFEDATVGQPPGGDWAVVTPNCSGEGSVTVDDTNAHSGTNSVLIDGKGGYCQHIFIANTSGLAQVGDVAHIRFYVRFSAALQDGHVTFVAMKDEGQGGKDLRVGGQNKVLMWNREEDDATLPSMSPQGVALSAVPATNQWLCVELMVDQAQGLLETKVDGQTIEGLVIDQIPTDHVDANWLPFTPKITDLKLGWEAYSGQAMKLWFDDVVVSSSPIGCDD